MVKLIKFNDLVFNDKRIISLYLIVLLCEFFFLIYKWGCKRYWLSVFRRGKVLGKNVFVLSERLYL